MSLPINFSPSALESLRLTIEFIKEKWGKKSSDKFKADLYRVLNTISTQPYIFKASSLAPEVRKGIISKQTSFFYQVHKDQIEVLFFWDNRQEPII